MILFTETDNNCFWRFQAVEIKMLKKNAKTISCPYKNNNCLSLIAIELYKASYKTEHFKPSRLKIIA